MGIVNALWTRLHEPRAVTFAAIVIYAMSGLFGWALLLLPPHRTLFLWEQFIGLVDSVGLIVGGAVGLFAALRGLWWLERVGAWAVGFAYVAQIPLMWNMFDNLTWHVILIVSVFEACAGIGLRLSTISWAYLDPMSGKPETG